MNCGRCLRCQFLIHYFLSGTLHQEAKSEFNDYEGAWSPIIYHPALQSAPTAPIVPASAAQVFQKQRAPLGESCRLHSACPLGATDIQPSEQLPIEVESRSDGVRLRVSHRRRIPGGS